MAKKPTQQCTEINLSDHQLPDCGICYQIILNFQQVNKYIDKVFKSHLFKLAYL